MSLAFGVSPLGDDLVLGVVSVSGPPATRPVVALLDGSGSLAGAGRERVAALWTALEAALPPAWPRTAVAFARRAVATSAIAERSAPAAIPFEETLGGRGDLVAAAALVDALATQAGLHGPQVDLVLVGDLALRPTDLAALRGLEARGARLHLVRVAGGSAPSAGVPIAVELGPELDPAVEAILERLGSDRHDRDALGVDLAAVPRTWFAWSGGALTGGGPASLARVEVRWGPDALAFVTSAADARGTAATGVARFSTYAAGASRLTFDATTATPVDPALLAAVRAVLGLPAGAS